LNEVAASDADELFNLALYSESIIVRALRVLNPPQLYRFKSRLRVLGVEVRDLAYHHQQACGFGGRLTQDACNFDLSPAERVRAVENLRVPGNNQDPIDTDADLARECLQPRSLLYRKQQLDSLIQVANVQLAAYLQSIAAAPKSPHQTYFEITEFQGPSDALLYGDNSQTSSQPPIFLVSDSEPLVSGSRSKNRFTILTDINQKVQEAHEEIVDLRLASFGIALTDSPPSAVVRNSSPSIILTDPLPSVEKMAISTEVYLPLPVLPQGWTGEKDFKAIGTVSKATQRSIEPVGPHFLAHARRARHKRTFSEDDRIQAQESVKKVEDDDAGEISEPEDPAMLMRDAKDWKAGALLLSQENYY
jgi:hypothetical protein